MIPCEIFVDIASRAPGIYGALLETCRDVHVALTGVNPWRLFTRREVSTGAYWVEVRNIDLRTGEVLTRGIKYSIGPYRTQLTLKGRRGVEISMDIMTHLGIIVHRITFHHRDRNEIIWGTIDHCNRLIAKYGVGDVIKV